MLAGSHNSNRRSLGSQVSKNAIAAISLDSFSIVFQNPPESCCKDHIDPRWPLCRQGHRGSLSEVADGEGAPCLLGLVYHIPCHRKFGRGQQENEPRQPTQVPGSSSTRLVAGTSLQYSTLFPCLLDSNENIAPEWRCDGIVSTRTPSEPVPVDRDNDKFAIGVPRGAPPCGVWSPLNVTKIIRED